MRISAITYLYTGVRIIFDFLTYLCPRDTTMKTINVFPWTATPGFFMFNADQFPPLNEVRCVWGGFPGWFALWHIFFCLLSFVGFLVCFVFFFALFCFWFLLCWLNTKQHPKYETPSEDRTHYYRAVRPICYHFSPRHLPQRRGGLYSHLLLLSNDISAALPLQIPDGKSKETKSQPPPPSPPPPPRFPNTHISSLHLRQPMSPPKWKKVGI